jgi:hypothetical protein
MARLFVTGINLNKNELQNARVQNLSSAPSSPVAGQIYFDTTYSVLYFYNGAEWIPASGSTEVIQDLIGSSLVGGVGLTSTYNDTAGTTTVDLDNTTVTAGTHGSTAAKTVSFTVDQQGRLTAASEQNIQIATSQVTGLQEFIEDSVNTVIVAGEGIDVAYDDTANTYTVSAEDASTSNKGVASFNSDDFNTTDGHVELEDTVVKAITTDSGALTPSTHGISILGGEGVDVTHSGASITVAAEDASSSNKGVASFDSTDFTVTSGNVILNAERVEDIVGNLVLGGTGIDATYTDGAGTLSIDIDSTVTTNSGTQTLTNKTLGSSTSLSANLDANSNKIINLSAPTSSTDAANKAYVDSVSQGLDVKQSVRVSTTTNVDLSTDLEAGDVIDGVTLVAGNRVLVKHQTTGADNGLYVVQSSGAAVRADDANISSEVTAGFFTFVEEGTLYGNTGWVLTTDNPITLGTTPLTFTQFSGTGTFTAGSGLTLNGTEFSVDVTPSSTNASLINTGGAVEVKLNTSDGLEVTANGVGINNGTGFTFSSGALVFDTANGYGVRKIASSVGDGSATSYTVTHGLATRDVTIQIFDNSSPYAQVEADVEHTDSNTATIKFAVAPTTDQYRVVVVG